MDYVDANPNHTNRDASDSGPFEDPKSDDVEEVQRSASALDSPTAADDRVYPMNGAKRGKVLIFNNVKFKDGTLYPTRVGSDKDVKRLQKTLPRLGFLANDIIICKDYSYNKIMNTVKELKNDKELKQADCVIIFVLSHGFGNDLVMAKDISYYLSCIIDELTPYSLPSMAGKPKILIVQACRGDKIDTGVLIRPIKIESGKDQDYVDSHRFYTIPEYADLTILRSSHDGHVSYRNAAEGSWLIQDFCTAISKSDLQTTSFDSILTETKFLVSTRTSKGESENKKQAASVYSTATRQIYFRPSK